jgi:hypothetical protein
MLFELFGRTIAVIGGSGVKQLLGFFPIDGKTLGLPVGAKVATFLDALVPIET